VIATPVHPAAHLDLLADQCLVNLSAVMASHGLALEKSGGMVRGGHSIYNRGRDVGRRK
jgi:hypothetical protein